MDVFVGIMLVLILLVAFATLEEIKQTREAMSKPKTTTKTKHKTKKAPPKNVKEVSIESFKEGCNQNWAVIQTILFKMYSENELLDYDSIYVRLREQLDKFSRDNTDLVEWNKKYVQYLKDKGRV